MLLLGRVSNNCVSITEEETIVMKEIIDHVLYDALKERKIEGEFTGAIISKCKDFIIFSDNIKISELEGISISQGLLVGFEEINDNKKAVSKKSDFLWQDLEESILEYSIQIPEKTMEKYDRLKFSDDFPFTINLSHTAGLYLNDAEFSINHFDFFKDEILKNPVSLIMEGIIFADRVSIDHNGNPFFYDCIIVGRDKNDNLNVSYEDYINVDDKLVHYIIILGIEDLQN